jgi:CheY-like chemotaxis protein
LTRPRVLLIDDDPAARYATRKLLDADQFHILEASDAQDGLRLAITMQPRLVVLDLNLPDRRGESLLEELAAGDLTKDIAVVIASSEVLTESKREHLGRHAVAVLQKGELTQGALRQALDSFVRRVASPA